uniref:Uncharacterized protein n=1 Tax=Glossina morsitans morsitans TaxID=37546 RepID=A0A1B0FHQ5_GLOMM
MNCGTFAINLLLMFYNINIDRQTYFGNKISYIWYWYITIVAEKFSRALTSQAVMTAFDGIQDRMIIQTHIFEWIFTRCHFGTLWRHIFLYITSQATCQ